MVQTLERDTHGQRDLDPGYLSPEAAAKIVLRALKVREIPSDEALVERKTGPVVRSLATVATGSEATYLPSVVQEKFGDEYDLSEDQVVNIERTAERIEQEFSV